MLASASRFVAWLVGLARGRRTCRAAAATGEAPLPAEALAAAALADGGGRAPEPPYPSPAEACEAAPLWRPSGAAQEFLLAARLASVACLNTPAGRVPRRVARLAGGEKPVPVAKRVGRRRPQPVHGPLVLRPRHRPAAVDHAAGVVVPLPAAWPPPRPAEGLREAA